MTETYDILVIDDEAGIRRGCERILKAEGFSVLMADSGESGLERLAEHPEVALVLVDLKMPGISGLEFLNRARADAVTETVFVVITAYATIESAVAATKRGAYDFIAKPFTPDALLNVVRRSIERVGLIREKNRLETERRAKLLELATEKGRLRTIIDCMADGVLVCNAENVLVLNNPAALRLFGEAAETPGISPVAGVLASSALAGIIEEASSRGKRLSREIPLASEPEQQVVLANTAPVFDPEGGGLLGTVTVVRDISALKQIEAVKAQFVNMVAHELRAPLAAVDGFLSTLEAGYVSEPERQKEVVSRSRKRLLALIAMVEDLLGMARMEAGTTVREIAPQKIGEILEEVVALVRPIAEKNRVCIEDAVSEAPFYVEGDREELIRLFTNLAGNAVKYNIEGGRVAVRAEKAGPYVKIAVSDTGIGITPEGKKRLFTEFFREKRPETRHVTGTGLGLSIVKRIIDFYHGRIEVDSEPGKGSTFTVWLPASAAS